MATELTVHPDADLANADWPKRTPDRLSDLLDAKRELPLEERYSPDQPRVPAGSEAGGEWTNGLVSPITSGDIVPAKGREAILTDDPTRLENLSPELRKKMLKKLQEEFPGMTQEQMEENLQAQLEKGLADPTNNGRTWYAEAKKTAGTFDYPMETSVGAIAAMSPQMAWADNVADARFVGELVAADPVVDRATLREDLYGEVIDQLAGRGVTPGAWDGSVHLSDLPPLEAAAYVKAVGRTQGITRVDDMTGKTGKSSWGPLPVIANGIRIYRGESADEVLNGHKVRSFYDDILDDGASNGAVTIDTHALSAAVDIKVPATDDRMAVLSSPTSREYSSKGTYAMFADAYRAVAERNGLTPKQAQATIWIEWRKSHP